MPAHFDDLLSGFIRQAKAQIIRHPSGLRFSFICDADIEFWLRPPGKKATANQMARRAGHEFPFDFTPLLKAEVGKKPEYVLWLEGGRPGAAFRWRNSVGYQLGPDFFILADNPISALSHLISILDGEAA